jgi:hypothetical protein
LAEAIVAEEVEATVVEAKIVEKGSIININRKTRCVWIFNNSETVLTV